MHAPEKPGLQNEEEKQDKDDDNDDKYLQATRRSMEKSDFVFPPGLGLETNLLLSVSPAGRARGVKSVFPGGGECLESWNSTGKARGGQGREAAASSSRRPEAWDPSRQAAFNGRIPEFSWACGPGGRGGLRPSSGEG